MSFHNKPKYQIPELIQSLKNHGLEHDKPSQLADSFRTGWIAGRAAAQAAQPEAVGEPGWCTILVKAASFDNLISAMDRAERKGYLPDAVVDEWLQFDYKTPTPEPMSAPTAEPVDDFEVRADGHRVRKDRWEYGIRRIVAVLWGNRKAFEIDDVVDAVRALAPKDHEDDANLADAILATPPSAATPEPSDAERPMKSLNALIADQLRPFLKPGDKVIWREAFRWHDDNGVLSNHYDSMSVSNLADDFGYEFDWDFNMNHAAIVRATKGGKL